MKENQHKGWISKLPFATVYSHLTYYRFSFESVNCKGQVSAVNRRFQTVYRWWHAENQKDAVYQ